MGATRGRSADFLRASKLVLRVRSEMIASRQPLSELFELLQQKRDER